MRRSQRVIGALFCKNMQEIKYLNNNFESFKNILEKKRPEGEMEKNELTRQQYSKPWLNIEIFTTPKTVTTKWTNIQNYARLLTQRKCITAWGVSHITFLCIELQKINCKYIQGLPGLLNTWLTETWLRNYLVHC